MWALNAPRNGGRKESGTRPLCSPVIEHRERVPTYVRKKMKKTITIIAIMLIGIAFTGCGTIMNSQVHHASTQELLLARYQLAVRTNRSAWGMPMMIGQMICGRKRQSNVSLCVVV